MNMVMIMELQKQMENEVWERRDQEMGFLKVGSKKKREMCVDTNGGDVGLCIVYYAMRKSQNKETWH